MDIQYYIQTQYDILNENLDQEMVQNLSQQLALELELELSGTGNCLSGHAPDFFPYTTDIQDFGEDGFGNEGCRDSNCDETVFGEFRERTGSLDGRMTEERTYFDRGSIDQEALSYYD